MLSCLSLSEEGMDSAADAIAVGPTNELRSRFEIEPLAPSLPAVASWALFFGFGLQLKPRFLTMNLQAPCRQLLAGNLDQRRRI